MNKEISISGDIIVSVIALFVFLLTGNMNFLVASIITITLIIDIASKFVNHNVTPFVGDIINSGGILYLTAYAPIPLQAILGSFVVFYIIATLAIDFGTTCFAFRK